MLRPASLLSALVTLGAVLACNRPADDLREWQATDHHHTSEPSGEPSEGAERVSGTDEAPMPGLEEVTIAAWQRSCTRCHGQLGRGDGPQAGLTKARDLSDPAWQAAVTDERIAETIVKGKGLMPANPLPATTVQGLVQLVRLFNRDRAARTASAPQASATAAAAAPPAGGTP